MNRLEKTLAIIVTSTIIGTGFMGLYNSFNGDVKSASRWYVTTNLTTALSVAGAGLRTVYNNSKNYKIKDSK